MTPLTEEALKEAIDRASFNAMSHMVHHMGLAYRISIDFGTGKDYRKGRCLYVREGNGPKVVYISRYEQWRITARELIPILDDYVLQSVHGT